MFFSEKLKSISNINHSFFSRKNGTSGGIYKSLNCGLGSNDDKEKVIQNISIVRKKINCEKNSIVTLNQIHSNKVVYLNNKGETKHKMIGDAIVTKLRNIGIAVLTADCVPILISDPKKNIIGCIHAGWRGALNGIIENTIYKFLELNSKSKDLIAAVGPCINFQSYEVGDDFYKNFISKSKNNNKFFFNSKNKKYYFNIRYFVNSKLNQLGIKNIDNIIMDTFSDEENFFSYRRAIKNNDPDYGRCISVIIMT